MPNRILIVDDEPDIVVSLEFLMRGAGYDVLVARDGREAMQLALSARPDLVVLDVMLPHASGFDVCRHIRDSPEGASVRILLLTARGREEELAKVLAAGADGYMTKPFSTRELVATVARLLAGRPGRPERSQCPM